MTEPLLDLSPGEKLQLQLLATGHEERYATTLIGYLHGKSLLITTPEVEGRVLKCVATS
ncbi:MAG: flagellar brake protein [gamma proteobacterium symbiont of Phacoides pectinatus]